jgi:hypothetical protein
MKYIIFVVTIFFLGCSQSNDIVIKPTKPYGQILSDIENQRVVFNLKYHESTAEGKKAVIKESKQFLFDQLTLEIFPSWYGTKWDFNGVTETPKEGYIACGYFVTTTLRDLGLKIPRVKWAQAASETMILAATKEVKRFSNAEMKEVEEWLLSRNDGIYIVGLDNHTGFVYKKGAQLISVHSSPYNKAHGVIAEEINTHSPLTVSNYRVFGEILKDEMVLNWIEGNPY